MRTLIICLTVFLLTSGTSAAVFGATDHSALEANGLSVLSTSVRGLVEITGVAQHPTFRKWQLDLLIQGDPEQTTFLAVSETAQPTLGELTLLDTTRYPNGNHTLRLRVVHSNLNYDEYFTALRIENPAQSDDPNAPESTALLPVVALDQPLGAGLPDGERRIEVDLSEQMLTAWQGEAIVLQTIVSTGRAEYPTVIGTWPIRVKYVSTRMIGPGYDTPNVPWTMYFHWGYAIHGAYWHNDFGTPVSHGCVNMRPAEAKLLFDWASEGTPVTVHE